MKRKVELPVFEEYQYIIEAASQSLFYTSLEELKQILRLGIHLKDYKTWFSLNEKGEHCHVISIEDCFHSSISVSRFPKIIDMACTGMRHWSCNSNIIRSPTVASAGNNVNSSKVLVLGGTGRVGGSTALALSKLKPDLRLVIAGRADIQLYADIANWTGLLWILDKFDDWFCIVHPCHFCTLFPSLGHSKSALSLRVRLISDKVYTLTVELLKKLALINPSHRKFFIVELSDLAHSLSSKAVQELITLKNTHMLGLSTGLMAGSSVLRIMQTLNSLTLVDGNKSKGVERDGNQEHVTLWQELSECIGVTESQLGQGSLSLVVNANVGDPSLPLGTQRLLPLIEVSWFCVISSKKTVRFQQDNACATESKINLFDEKHHRLLNAFVRQDPGLDRVISRLQQPVPLEYIPDTHIYFISGFFSLDKPKDLSELLQSAARDYGTLAASVSDIHSTHNFQEPPSSSGNVSPRFQKGENQEGEDETDNDVDDTNGKRFLWHSDMDNGL
ncbi:E3 ubiquitin protein ligase UPL1-like protein [Tanacetum coccineum]|uniref:E3 ubiquitin protein ligase UPL1-like protein n=1 Tax=Tanacetum coccineum TaxID=301880 RepID=A0ABQ5BX33_9ASTR